MKVLTLSDTAKFLLENDRYVIVTHRRPDGDTIGCAVALCRGLRNLGKAAWVLENPQFTPKFRPYLDGLTTDSVEANTCLVAVDIAAESLLSLSAADYVNQFRLLIDHHGRNTAFAERGYVDSNAAACGEIILLLLQSMDA